MIGEAAVARYVRMKLSGHTPKKAKIEVYKDLEGKTVDRDKSFSVMFNPTQIGYTKGVKWVTKEIPEDDSGMKYSSGGEAPTFRIELFFDSTDTGKDVRDAYTDKLEKLTYIVHKDSSTKKPSQPPVCRFIWGRFQSFLAIVPSVTLSFQMFLADGTPVRASADVEFREYVHEEPSSLPFTNPTSRSLARKIWRVSPGESLDFIAFQEYGDPALWKHIAATNNLSNPMDLRPGQVLKLVPLS